MASKEDDNKLPQNCNTNNDRQVNIISVYKRLEYVLNNRTESFTNKVESLIEVWKQVSQCRLTEHKQYVVHLMDWLKLHTLNIVLTGDWKKLKDTYEERLLKEVKHCEMLLLHSNNIFSLRCRKLAEVIKDPWGSPVLGRLLNDPEVEIGPEEIDFFGMETGYLISTRLRKLCESHCEDLALNLVTSFMRCHQLAEVQSFNLNATEDQKRFIMDVYIALLYKYKKTPLIISTLKSLTLKEGLELLKRFAHKRVNISKIWRHSSRIAHLAAQVYVTAAVMKPPKESSEVLEGLLETWLFLNEGSDNWATLTTAVRRIIQAADSAIHMYIFCEAFYKKFGSLMKTFIIELYIRALTTDMNDLERQKNEDNTDKVAKTSERLAHGFLRLADVLNEHVKVSRECVLTSFSLKPTQSTLDRIVNLAKNSGYEVLDTGQNWKCKLHPSVDPSDEVCYKCNECGEYMSQMELKSPLNTNTALSEALTEEQLGLSPQLCDDLVVVLSSPRYQLFSWLVKWKDLHRLCVLYLNDPERTKNIVTELKFVDIDYSIFATVKREPEDEDVNGIERGYEHYLEDLYPEPCSMSSDESFPQETHLSSSDSVPDNFQLLPPPVAKSDPKVLKSLRLFRPNLKRSKTNQTDYRLPPKVFVSNTLTSPFGLSQTPLFGNYGQPHRIQNNPPFDHYDDSCIPNIDLQSLSNPYLPNRNSTNWQNFDQAYAQSSGFQNSSGSNYFNTSSKTTLEIPKDVALNLSVKDKPPGPIDLSKYRVKRNWAEFRRRLYVTTAVNNFLKTKNSMLQNKMSPNVDNAKSLQNMEYENKSWNTNFNLQNHNRDYKPTVETSQYFTNDYSQKTRPNAENLSIEKNSRKDSDENRNGIVSNVGIDFSIDSTTLGNSSSVNDKTVTYSTADTNSSDQIMLNCNSNAVIDLHGDNSVLDELSKDSNNEQNSQNFRLECTDSDSPENISEKCEFNINRDSCVDESNNKCAVPISSVDRKIVVPNSDDSVFCEKNEPTSESISKNVIYPACSGADDKDHCSATSVSNYHEVEKSSIAASLEIKSVMPANGVKSVIEESNCSLSSNIDYDSNYVPTESEEDYDVSSTMPNHIYEPVGLSTDEEKTNFNAALALSQKEFAFSGIDQEKIEPFTNKKNHVVVDDLVSTCAEDAQLSFVEDDSTLSDDRIKEDNICAKSSMANEIDKSNDENKIPNWCDFSFLKGNLTVTFSKRIENFDDAIRSIKVFDDKDAIPSEYNKVECNTFKAKKKLISKTRNVNFRKSIDNKSKSISNAIKLETKKSKRAIKSKGVIKKNILTEEKTTAVKPTSSLVRKCTKVKDGSKNELLDLVKKYKLKEARVVLHRLTWPDSSDKKDFIKSNDRNVQKQSKLVSKKTLKKSENMNKAKSKGKGGVRKSKGDLKPWPLQDISPKVNRYKDARSDSLKKDKCNSDLKTDINSMNPCVVLKRLDFDKDKKRNATSVLAQVPGLNDLQMIRPSSVDRIVQVVQVPGARTTANVPIPNTQTSTQVTPHIQRIGQPRAEKPVTTESETTTSTTVGTSTAATSTTSESPTLINILSQQIIRPANQNNCVNLKPRTSPLINILSQQIIKPATTVSNTKVTSSSGSTEAQVNNIPRVISGGDQIISQLINQVRAPAPTLKTLVSASGSDQNRILQFICKSSDGKLIPVTSFASNKVVKVSMTQTVNSADSSNVTSEENFTKIAQNSCKAKPDANESLDTLPKFQQAFGKPAYHNNVDSTEATGNANETINVDVDKTSNVKNQPKNSSASLNVQPVQGGVIYTRQVPVGQTINLIPPGRGQVFRIATSNPEQLSFVKDSVIQGKMSALLAAALQGKQRVSENNDTEISTEDNSQSSTRVTLTARPPLVQNARIVKPVLQIPSNVIRSAPQSNLSSTTLEQLREFDMVYKQVKERSSTNAPTESSPQSDSNETTQQISVTYLNQSQKINCAPVVVVSSYCNVQPAASPSLSVTSQGSSSPCVTPAPTLSLSSKTASKSPKSKSVKSATTHTTKASPIPKPQQKPQEDEHTTQRIFDILAEYAEQLRNSPDLNNKPAPRRRSNPPTNPNQNAKRKKSSTTKKIGQSSNSLASDGDLDDTHTVGSEDSSCGVVQISVQDDEQPLPSVNTSESSEASASPQQLILTDSAPNQSHSLIIADSNVGEALKMSNTAVLVPGNYIMPVSMVKGGQQIAVVSGGSKILATVPARSGPNMLLFQSFLNQTRKHGLPTVKYSAIQPISGIARNISGVTTQSTTTVPATTQNLTAVTLSPSVGLQKINQFERVEVNNFDATEVFLAISQPQDNKTGTEQQQNDRLTSTNAQSVRLDDDTIKSESSFDEEKSSVATSVIAQTKGAVSEEQSSTAATIMALNLNSSDNDKDATIKVEGRVQSVLVATGTSNGPMLSHNTPTYNKQIHTVNSVSEPNKDEYLRNEGKQSNTEPKNLPSGIIYPFQNKIKKTPVGSQRLDRELHQLSLQRKQAALERELKLQKSLSEECEDLGVDEPSASDLFPEADLLFDSNHSPSFDQTSQDLVKRVPVVQEVKEERAIGIFCDDEPMRTDFLFEPIEYQAASVEAEYDRSRDVRNGQGNPQSALTCEDNTLLRTCTSMSDVTIPSPISPEPYADLSPPNLSKRKFSYTNRKKTERVRHTEHWSTELSSSEDTTGSTELVNSTSHSPEPFSGKRDQNLNCDEELYSFTIVERLPLKDDQECQEIDCEGVAECPSGRGARRSVKKTCSCCNGTVKVARKRPASRPPSPIKKTVTAKKR
ncbi:hypothetical protein RN001_015882 [Aquatica leii]|uniref:Uncharacterized protein n=1 Tax=Aquatica leii TaxID=1421715 RepID=A0AAN7QAW9_9COLE|nr:hypothetical protein RN001_015882 [Aquatica leii]